jgi:DNA-binding XRE family transcriptional regulator
METAMTKPANRPYSRYSREAAELLGQLIRQARIERRLTAAALAQRASLSRGLVIRIEKGDPGCAIGAVFEAAAVVGVRLFDADQATLTDMLRAQKATLTLLPRSARVANIKVNDAF